MAKKNTSQSGAWMVTTIILGALLFLSLVWNGVLTMMLVGGLGGSGMGDSQVAAPSPSPAAPSPSPAAPTPTVDVSADDDAILGDPNAPVELIEFSDFECPFCGRFYSDSLAQIKAEYVDTGKVKVIYRDFPLSFHPRATPAAVAAECVGELLGDEAYYEMHDILFENQGALDDASLRANALAVGVDAAAYDECYADADGSMAAEVQKDFEDGQAAGVSGTPTVFVNGKKIVGAQPFAVFKAAIDAELA